MVSNLYVHFPFCRTKCSYCALYSRAGIATEVRQAYIQRLKREIPQYLNSSAKPLSTIYFGGGSPALCDLSSLGAVMEPFLTSRTEFTVELHPLDVTAAKLDELKSIGVNRISMGVQSLNDEILSRMGRGYDVAAAERAFALIRRYFDNAGIDLIVGYPCDRSEGVERLKDWGLKHCSVYSLQNDRGLKDVWDDDTVLNRIHSIAGFLQSIGLCRYEISNYAVRGFECQHNFAVWRGEDYIGLGEGACGRVGLKRTRGVASGYEESDVSPDFDRRERTLFRLRTKEGLDASQFPEWIGALNSQVELGTLTRRGSVYFLTDRGTEVCDSILCELAV